MKLDKSLGLLVQTWQGGWGLGVGGHGKCVMVGRELLTHPTERNVCSEKVLVLLIFCEVACSEV